MRKFPRPVELVITLACVLTSLFYLYTGYVGSFPLFVQIGLIMGVCLALCFLYTPPVKGHVSKRSWIFAIDLFISFLVLAIAFYLAYKQMTLPFGEETPLPGTFDIFVGAVLMILVTEGVRRVAGWPMVILITVMFLYARFGEMVPGAFSSSDFSLKHIIRYTGLEVTGIYGVALNVVSIVLIPFFIFSCLLQGGGTGDFFIALPQSLIGRFRGGSAKLSVVASSLFGTISGSASANVAAIGTFTIPLMKKGGYRPEIAGAVEALSSTGGQIMPPVMGVAAFVMAELLAVSYWTVVTAAVLPAIIYYVAVFVSVHLEAAKSGIPRVPQSELPNAWKILRNGWFLALPLVILVVLLGPMAMPPQKGCVISILAMIVVSWFRKDTRLTPIKLWRGLNEGIRSIVVVTVFCAGIGVIIGLVGLSGLGPNLSNILVDLSGGNMLVLLILTAIASLILGMGLSTTPCYLFLALLVAPALIRMGLSPMAAHMFVFYFGMLSTFTPPVAISCFAAAPIAKAGPMRIGLEAVRMGAVIYFMPFFFVYNQGLLMKGSAFEIVSAFILAVLGAICFGFGTVGYFLSPIGIPERILWIGGGIALFFNTPISYVIAIFMIAVALILQMWRKRKAARPEKIALI